MDRTDRRSRRLGVRGWLAAWCLAVVALAVAAAGAQAREFGIWEGSFRVELSDSQAAGHPNITTSFVFRGERRDDLPPPWDSLDLIQPYDNVKDMVIDVPPGLIGNPQAMPKCKPSQFPDCPLSTQVGTVTLGTLIIPEITAPVFNMEPAQGKTAQFAFLALLFQIQVTAEIRSDGNYALRMIIPETPTTAPLFSSRLTFWGVPNAPENDRLRGAVCSFFLGCTTQDGRPYPPEGIPARSAVVPFTSAPPQCGVTMTARMRANSWQRPDQWVSAETTIPPLTGCDRLTFGPTLTVEPTTKQAGAPTGLAVDIEVPQNDAPGGVGTPPLKRAAVTLPEGMVVSPSAATGLEGCTDAQFGVGALGRPSCPRGSEIGTATIISPLQAEPMTGSIYLGTQTPSQLLRLFMYVEGGGVELKLPGTIDTDPVTGQLTAMFDDQPMLAASRISLRFKDGPRAVVANPSTCGVKTVTSTITSYGGVVASPSSSFEISADGRGAPCGPIGFDPSFSAGTVEPVAGQASTFTLTFGRGDNQQDLRAIDLRMPDGLTGRVADVAALCPAALAASGACDEGSRIGSARVASGPGSNPFWLPGRVYLTEAYGGGQFGLSIVVPAVAGPLDLGTVVVRAAIHVDRRSAALRIVSDPMPTILQGIPLQIRTVNVAIDRRGFMLNPTSCAPTSVSAAIGSAAGATVARENRFQVGDCASLSYKPRMTLRVGAKGRTRANVRTPLTAVLSQPAGQANNREVVVRLPKTINARLDVVNRACSIDEYRAGQCGEEAKIGEASVVTPILRDPLRGPVYFVKSPERRLPDMVVQLRGQVAVDLVGLVSIPRSLQLTSRFTGIPDIPVTRFRLTLRGGRNGLLGTAQNLCTVRARRARGSLVLRGQNGVVDRRSPRLQIAGCGAARRSAAKQAAKAKRAAATAARTAAATDRNANRR